MSNRLAMPAHNLFERAHLAWLAGRLEEATRMLEHLLHTQPNHAAAWHLLGAVALRGGHLEEALVFLLKAIELDGVNADIWCDLGTAYHGKRQLGEAEQAYHKALALRPVHRDALFNLANVLRERKRSQEALLLYAQLLRMHPEHIDGWNNTGLALMDAQQPAEARRCFEQVLALDSRNVLAAVNLGALLRDAGKPLEAVENFRRALVFHPNHSGLLVSLGSALSTLGQTAEAIQSLRQAIAIAPTLEEAHSSLIFTLDYDASSSTQTQQAARRAWYECCVRPHRTLELPAYTQPASDRKLRVGYLSPDFRATSAAVGFSPMLYHYDRERFEVWCYANNVAEDAVTVRIRASVNGYRCVAGLVDAELAQQIRSDRIDILVDLCGHMRGSRLKVFAHRPAPLQMTGWGYANGTGMPEMDYILADQHYLPDDDLCHFSERRADIPSVIPYSPFEELPALAPPPIIERGHITFGCYSRFDKISANSIRLWARILSAVPTARLLLKSSSLVDDGGLRLMQEAFAREDIDPARVEVRPRTAWWAHMQSFSELDIQLDPIPHGGGISLLDGLAMGVPSVAMSGNTPPGRLAYSLLRAMELDSRWVAKDESTYIDMAVQAARANSHSMATRAALRDRLLSSSVGDTKRYVRAVEVAYRRTWEETCAKLRTMRGSWIDQCRSTLKAHAPQPAVPMLERLINGDQSDTEALELAGVAAHELRNFSTAETLLRQAVARADCSSDGRINLGIVLTSLSRSDEAIEVLQDAVKRYPRNLEARYNYGCALLTAGCYQEAQAAFEQALEIEPFCGKVINNLALALEELGENDKAMEWLKLACAKSPDYALSHANLGRHWLRARAPHRAMECFERALELDPSLHWIRFELLVLYQRLHLKHRSSRIFSGLASVIARCADRQDAEMQKLLVDAVLDDLRGRHSSPQTIEQQLLDCAARLMALDHSCKTLVLNRLIALAPESLIGYMQLGIAYHHDERCDLAAEVWFRGLRKRDELATNAGLQDLPHRVLDSSWYMAAGHLQMFDSYLKSAALGNQSQRKLWLLRVPRKKFPNTHYLNYWRPWLNEAPSDARGDNRQGTALALGISPSHLPLVTDHYFAIRESAQREFWHMQYAADVQRSWEAQNRPPLLQLTAQDRSFGHETLEKLGLPSEAWYVCVHVREGGFWANWDTSHPSIRNARIETYIPAMKEVVARGGYVIRMGDRSMQPLAPMHGVIDYAHSEHKSERMDVFLAGSCRLFVGVNSGMSLLPPTFGVPCLLTNFTPIAIPLAYGRDRMLPKLFRHRRENRLLSIEEMFKHRVAHSQFAKHVPPWAEVIDNSPEDIREGVGEMLDELSQSIGIGEHSTTQSLRRIYDQALVSNGAFIGSPIAGRFLNRYGYLLEQPARSKRKRR